MAKTDLQALVDFGIFNAEGVSRIATMIESLQQLSAAGLKGFAPRGRRRRGRPPAATRGRRRGRVGRPHGKASRGKRGKFNPSKAEIKAMRKTMTVAEIAKAQGVSTFTVNARLKKHKLIRKRK